MALDVDLLLDRRRLKRRLIVWRTLAIVVAVIAVLTGLRGAGLTGGESRIARLSITGIITEDRKLTEAIRASGRDPHIKALIVAINSPGGSVSGGESLHRAIAGVAEKKPVVAVMGGLAASAGYMIAMPANRVFARESTVTGSIGVLMETGEVSGLLEKLGISAEAITSGPLKDQPSLTRPLTPAGREALRGIILDMYDQFVGMVAAGRHMEPDAVRVLADGRAYTGRQALKLGLIDAIGDEQDARKWLQAEKGLSVELPVEDISASGLAGRMLASELSSIVETFWKTLLSQSVILDLPWAVWQH
ncbi:MAG: signal peptide peptidase SppA [Acetobacteraceae bacterium]|nr:signal peptide peptidase SppA [Acetobacteraceae bacterium]